MDSKRLRYSKSGERRFGCIQIAESNYSALPAAIYSKVKVRIYEREIEILDAEEGLLRRHQKSNQKGSFMFAEGERLFNPSRETLKLFERVCSFGPNSRKLAEQILAVQDRPAHKQIYGLSNLARTFTAADIEAVAVETNYSPDFTVAGFTATLKRRVADKPPVQPELAQSGQEATFPRVE